MGDLQLPLWDAFNLAFSGYRLSNMWRIILIFNMESIEAGEMLDEEQYDEFNHIQRIH